MPGKETALRSLIAALRALENRYDSEARNAGETTARNVAYAKAEFASDLAAELESDDSPDSDSIVRSWNLSPIPPDDDEHVRAFYANGAWEAGAAKRAQLAEVRAKAAAALKRAGKIP